MKRMPLRAGAAHADTTGYYDFLAAYVGDLANVLDIDAIRDAGVHIGADPLGGAIVGYWARDRRAATASTSTVVNPTVDPHVRGS